MIVLAVLLIAVGAIDVLFYKRGGEIAAQVLRGSIWKSVERSAKEWRQISLGMGIAILTIGCVVLIFSLV